MTVSVIVAALKAEDLLRRFCVDFGDLGSCGVELIVIDGGSNDGSEQVVRGVKNAIFLSEPDRGVADAWNKGLQLASGDWIAFAGADDRLAAPADWRRTIEVLDSAPADVSLLAFPVAIVSPRGASLGTATPQPGVGHRRLKAVNAIPHQGLFARSAVFRRIGAFDTAFGVAADYDWVLRAAIAGEAIRLVKGQSPIRMTFGGLSKRSPLRTVIEFRRVQRKLGVRGLRLAWWPAFGRACLRAVVQQLFGPAPTGRLADWGRRLRGRKRVWTTP